MRQKGTKSDGGSWEIREYDVRVGCFLSLCNYAKKQNLPLYNITPGQTVLLSTSLKQLAKQATASIYTPTMHIIDLSIEGDSKLLQGLSPNKASGPDEMSPKILKELHHEIAPILTLIFNLSLEGGVVPIDWRTAYKKGSKSKANNYRPISLTCIASRLLEHILVSNIMSHFDDNNLLSQYQHGFRSEHSCESQLISFR